MKKCKTVLAMMLCLVTAICFLAGCGGSGNGDSGNQDGGLQAASGQSSTNAGNTNPADNTQIEDDEEIHYAEAIVILSDNGVAALDPMDLAADTIPAVWALTMIHDRLLAMDAGVGEIGAAIAVEWGTADNRTFNFKLRDDAVFHDGEKLTASDVIFTIGRAKESPGSAAYSIWGQVETASAINDFEVLIALAEENVNFLSDLTSPVAGILSETSIYFDPDFGPAIGTGAYAVIDYRQGNYLQLVRNETYWDTSRKVFTDWVRLQFAIDAETVIQMMQNGEAQVYYGLHDEVARAFEIDPEVYCDTRRNGIVVSAKGIGGTEWATDARNLDFRGIYCIS